MKDKHIHIPDHNDLLRQIHRRVEKEVVFDQTYFRRVILLKFVFYLSCMMASYTAIMLVQNPWLFMLSFVLFGFSTLLFAFNFAHDFAHGTIARDQRSNDLGFILIYTLNGAHAEAWKQRHVQSHHFAPNVEHYDSDLEISELIRVIPQSPRYKYHRFQHLYAPLAYMTYSLFWILIKDFNLFFLAKKKTRSYRLSFWVQKIFYLAYMLAIPLMFSAQPWFMVIAGFLLMHVLQSLFLLFTFFMTHHIEGLEYPTVDEAGNINTSWIMNQIKSSNDMYPFSETANFIFGGFNNHIAHHLFPHVHHIHYPALNSVLYDCLREHGIEPSQTSYWGGVKGHLRLLKLRSKE